MEQSISEQRVVEDQGQSLAARVLSGTHKGTEITLFPGEQTMGASESCDFVLWDEGVSDLLLTLTLKDDGRVFITPNGKDQIALYDAQSGQEYVCDEMFEVSHQDIVSCGQISLGFHHMHEVFSDLRITRSAPYASEANSALEDQESPGDSKGEEGAKSKHADAKKKQQTSSPKRRSSLFLPVGLLVIGALAYMFIPEDRSSLLQPASKRPSAQTSSASAQTKTPKVKKVSIFDIAKEYHLKVHKKRGGGYVFIGFVKTSDEKLSLYRKLNDLKSAHKLNFEVDLSEIRILESSLNLAKSNLKALSVEGVSVAFGKAPGSLILTGYQKEREAWQKTKMRLTQEVPGIIWQDQVDTLQDRLEALQRMITDNNLRGQVVVRPVGDYIEVRGALQENKRLVWMKIQKKFDALYKGKPALRDARPEISDLNIRSITLGRLSYITLANGEVLMKGATIDDVYTLSKIYKDRIVLERSGELLNYYLDESMK